MAKLTANEAAALTEAKEGLERLIRVYGWWLQANPKRRAPRDRWLPILSPRVRNPYLLRTDANGAPSRCVLLDSQPCRDAEHLLRDLAWQSKNKRALVEAENFEAARQWLNIKLSQLANEDYRERLAPLTA